MDVIWIWEGEIDMKLMTQTKKGRPIIRHEWSVKPEFSRFLDALGGFLPAQYDGRVVDAAKCWQGERVKIGPWQIWLAD
jgi:hypothetical protein